MNKSRLIRALLGLSVLTLAPVACERRPLYDPEERIRISVEVDVDNISNVTCDIYNPKLEVPDLTTDMMRVLVYGPTSKALLTQGFISEKSTAANGHQVISGTIEVGYGDFDIVSFNFDTPTTTTRDENAEGSLTAYTDEIPASVKASYLTKATDFAALPAYYDPEHLFVSREMGYHISQRDTLVTIYTQARTIIDTYYIQIRIAGLQNVANATGVVSGLSPSNAFVANVRATSPSSGIYFDLSKSTDEHLAGENKDVICALFNTFGKIDSATSDVLFTVTDVNGEVHQKTVNLDTIFKSEDAIKHHWLLIDEIWEIDVPDPTPGTSSGGFQPEVGDWESQEGGIDL